MVWAYIGIFSIGIFVGFCFASIFASGDKYGHIVHIFKASDGTIDHIDHDIEDIVIVHEDNGDYVADKH